jgi:hypothetical protein
MYTNFPRFSNDDAGRQRPERGEECYEAGAFSSFQKRGASPPACAYCLSNTVSGIKSPPHSVWWKPSRAKWPCIVCARRPLAILDGMPLPDYVIVQSFIDVCPKALLEVDRVGHWKEHKESEGFEHLA